MRSPTQEETEAAVEAAQNTLKANAAGRFVKVQSDLKTMTAERDKVSMWWVQDRERAKKGNGSLTKVAVVGGRQWQRAIRATLAVRGAEWTAKMKRHAHVHAHICTLCNKYMLQWRRWLVVGW